jgi:indole-3-glycerol phosphate synthase
VLELFKKAKAAEIIGLEALRAAGRMPAPYAKPRPPFVASLWSAGKAPVIAEYKRASPSRGELNMRTSPEEAAAAYAAAGTGALSVLTERQYFKGELAFLERMAGRGLPLLRKDFILHPLQVERTAATPASALLLIVRMLDEAGLRGLLEKSRSFGLEVVVEIFDRTDLAIARRAGAGIIQVNNRDLDRLRVDLGVSERLIREKSGGEFWITASGIESPKQLAHLLAAGFDAALVGSSLMRDCDPGRALRSLLGGDRNAEETLQGLRPDPLKRTVGIVNNL